MKKRIIFYFLFLALIITNGNAYETRPVAVSPGSESGMAVVSQSCPTFSWTAVSWATGYKIAVFEAVSTDVLAYEEMEAMVLPVLSKEIREPALSLANAQDKPTTADNIMKEALQRASKENKNVFLIFHASWCGMCKKMDAAMTDEVCKDSFDKNYVIIHMVVKESKNNKHLENPGAAEFLAKYKGDKSGIPFWLIFDKKGKLLADSFMRPEGVGPDQPGSNIGCPARDNEVATFIDILKASSSMTEKELAIISERFKKNRN